MSESAPEATTQETAAEQPSQEQAEQQDPSTLPAWAREAITKANAEAAKYRTQVRDLEPKAKQFSALEEASKTDQQRMQEALEAANRARDTAQADALRFRIAAEHGIGKDDLDLLGVGDEDTLTSRAQRLADLRVKAAAAEVAATVPKPAQRPTEQLRPGATPSSEQLSDEERLYAEIYGTQQ